MDRKSQLSQWALQISRLSADGDWGALATLDRELAALLLKLSGQRQWTRDERAVLADLQRAHEAARECCKRESARIDKQLSQMRERRDGWMAYALGDVMANELAEGRA